MQILKIRKVLKISKIGRTRKQDLRVLFPKKKMLTNGGGATANMSTKEEQITYSN